MAKILSLARFAFLDSVIRRTLLFGVSAFIFTGALFTISPPAAAECIGCGGSGNGDSFNPAPSGGTPTSFTVVLTGNQMSAFGLTGSSGTLYEPPWADAFCNPTMVSCPVAVTYSVSKGTTTVVFSGSSGIYSDENNGTYHFGLVGGCDICSLWEPGYESGTWTYTAGGRMSSEQIPILDLKCSCNAEKSKNAMIAIVYYAAQFKSGAFYQSWNAIPYIPKKSGEQPHIEFTNYGTQAIEVLNSGIVLGISPPSGSDGWYQLTSTMNLVDMPPPGSSGSPFTALTKPPKKILKPKQPCEEHVVRCTAVNSWMRRPGR